MTQLLHWALLLCFGACACASTQTESATAAGSPQAAAGSEAAAPASDEAVSAATAAAEAWLALVDSEQYDESWKAAAEVFRGAVSSEAWATAVGGVRRPLGKLGTRQLSSAEYKTSLPGAPDGKYVVIQFSSTFDNKSAAVETVTPMQESDGSWRVAGYYVK